MKNFKDVKIVACFMAHDDDEYIDMVLEDLSKYTDQIYVNIHDATPYITKAVKKHPNVRKYIVTDDSKSGGKWSQGLQRDNTIRLLDKVKPDIVLFPDSDETYPNDFKKLLEEFWNSEAITFWFRLFYLWGDTKHFRNDGIWKRIHHVRAYKWRPGITYLPRYAGYACPTDLIYLPRKTRFNAPVPIMHYGYMTEKNRTKKYLRAGPGYNYLRNHEYRAHTDKGMVIKEVPDEFLWTSQS